MLLANLTDMSEVFQAEVQEIVAQLDQLIVEHGVNERSEIDRNLTEDGIAGGLSSTTADRPQTQGTTLHSSMSTTSATTTSSHGSSSSPPKSKPSESFGLSATTPSNVTIDLLAIRKVQRRLGTLLYASELSAPIQEHLGFISDQLALQSSANGVVDEVTATACDELLDARHQESRVFLESMGKEMEHQSARLHDQTEKLAAFCLRVAQCMEQSVEKVRYIDLSAMDLLDHLKDDNDETLAELEVQFFESCAHGRHAPNETVLQQEFQVASMLLQQIEAQYRMHHRKGILAATHHVLAIERHHTLFLDRLLESFGLAVTQQPASSDANEDALDVVVKETYRTSSGLDAEVCITIPELVTRILSQNDDIDGNEGVETSKELETAGDAVTADPIPPMHDPVVTQSPADDATTDEVDAEAAAKHELRQRLVMDKVAVTFLRLKIPAAAMEHLVATLREAMVSKYDDDSKLTRQRTAATREERLADGNLLLEERLRMHWPRNGRLDVQIYQPRVGELVSHRQRLERQLRSVRKKVEAQEAAFVKHAQQALDQIEQVRVKQISCHAQLPMQSSLAALQGLEGKSKKLLKAFQIENADKLDALHTMIEADIATLVSSMQDFVRTCSNQQFPDLTSCENITTGCEYHPEDIAVPSRLANNKERPSCFVIEILSMSKISNCRRRSWSLCRTGKLEELPNGSVPPSLDGYLHGLADKARSYVLQQELKFREQVHFFEELLALAPEAALSDLLSRSSKALRQRNDTVARLQHYQAQVMVMYVGLSAGFETELTALFRCFMTILDTCVMTLDDLKPFSGDELPKLKRKSLKRLRKVARILEFGDAREVKRTDKELESLTQRGEVPRFPKRSWPAIPNFGLRALWDAQHAQILRHDEEQKLPSDDIIQALGLGMSNGAAADEDAGASVELLTHAHRSLVGVRDTVYASYAALCKAQSEQMLDAIHEKLRDELKSIERWNDGIAAMHST
ncbi:DNA-directed RNA polymerase iii subunit, partial [Globisporangium splendens]